MNFSMYTNFYKLVLRDGIASAADQALALGFSSVEFFDYTGKSWTDVIASVEEAKRMRAVLESRGLGVACYSVAAGLYEEGMTPDTVTHAEKKLMQYAEYAAALGCPYLHHTLTIDVERFLTEETALQYTVPAAVRIAKYAHSLGVSCIYEDQGPFFNGVEGFGKFFSALKAECPYVGVCGDVGNVLFVDASPAEFFRAYAEDIKHVHVKDYTVKDECGEGRGWSPSRGGKWLKETVIGEGVIELAACLDELRRVGYTGAFALENNHEEDFSLGVAIGMRLIDDAYCKKGG